MKPHTDVSTVTLQTPRLILRGWRESDLADFYAYASVEGVGEAAGWPHHCSIEETKRILAKFMAEKNDFAIVDRATGRVIGSLGLHRSWATGQLAFAGKSAVEIGYVLARDMWGRGLMPEAVGRVLEYLFDTLGVDIVTVAHAEENARSRRVIEKCGFRPVKRGTVYLKQLGKTITDIKYILTREEYQCKDT